MNGSVFVAVEKEAIPILLEDFRHHGMFSEQAFKSDQFILGNHRQSLSSELVRPAPYGRSIRRKLTGREFGGV
jgi:hypothetical protein